MQLLLHGYLKLRTSKKEVRLLFLDFFAGTTTIHIPLSHRRAMIALLIRNQIPVLRTVKEKDCSLSLTLHDKAAKHFLTLVEKRGLPPPPCLAHRGFPCLLALFAKRPGIPIGAVLFISILILSSLFCWRVDVICLDNDSLRDPSLRINPDQIRTELAEMGIGPGLYLPTLNVRQVENRYLIQNEDLSWMAINREGTVLSVEIRPSGKVKEDRTGKLLPGEDNIRVGTNLVADGDGIIVRDEIRSGVSLVLPEQMVTKGELLATGIFESKDGDVICGRVSGKIFAKTVRRLTAEIPFILKEEHYTGESTSSISLSCFGKTFCIPPSPIVTFLEIFKKNRANAGFSDAEYDIIVEDTPICLPNGVPLPIAVSKTVFLGKEQMQRQITRDEALLLAKESIDAQLRAMTDATVLSTECTESWEQERLVYTVDVFCIDNIAKETEYYVSSPK